MRRPGRPDAPTLFSEAGPDVLSIAQLYARIDRALLSEFPPRDPVWVRGEVHNISDRTGHCYIDLIDPETAADRQPPVVKVRCWRQTWGPLRAQLARSGIELTPGTVVQLFGRLEFYRARAEVSFVMAGLDVTALLGRLAAERAALIATLRDEGLLEANGALAVPPVVLRIGLVASPDTEGCRDFLKQLRQSGFAFAVSLSRALVQGTDAPRSVARAIRRAGASQPDLVVVVRGGGSRADLVAFDSAPVARAIANCPVPVWTGIGHTGDESVADIVANRSFVTPTECGHELVARLESFWARAVAAQATAIGRSAFRALEAADRHLAGAQGRVSANARQQLRWHRARLEQRTQAISRSVPAAAAGQTVALADRGARVAAAVRRRLGEAEEKGAGWRRLLAAYDLDRQLERGYTITTDDDGRILRSAAALAGGDVLLTRFADGTARSVVSEGGGGR